MTSTTYTIRSIKHTETLAGKRREIILRALYHEEEYQPAMGTDIEVGGRTVLRLDGVGDDLIETLRDEATVAEDHAQIALCDEALADDMDGATRVRVLAQILGVAVAAIEAGE